MKATIDSTTLTLSQQRGLDWIRFVFFIGILVFGIGIVLRTPLMNPSKISSVDMVFIVIGLIMLIACIFFVKYYRTWKTVFINDGQCTYESKNIVGAVKRNTFDFSDIIGMTFEIRRGGIKFPSSSTYTSRLELNLKDRGWTTVFNSSELFIFHDPYRSHTKNYEQISSFLHLEQDTERIKQRDESSFLNKKLF